MKLKVLALITIAAAIAFAQVVQQSTRTNSPNINGVNGDVNLTYPADKATGNYKVMVVYLTGSDGKLCAMSFPLGPLGVARIDTTCPYKVFDAKTVKP